jgi:hypothetical protein
MAYFSHYKLAEMRIRNHVETSRSPPKSSRAKLSSIEERSFGHQNSLEKPGTHTENQMREMVKKLPTPYKDKTGIPHYLCG